MSASLTTAKTKALFLEDELSKKFFMWLLCDRVDVDYIVCDGQKCATQIASQYTNYTTKIVLKDRDYRGNFQATANNQTEIVPVGSNGNEYVLRVTEIENLYAYVLRAIDFTRFSQVFDSSHIPSYISETLKRVCFSLLASEFWHNKCQQTNKANCTCNIDKTTAYLATEGFLNSNATNIDLMLSILACKEVFEIYKRVGKFDTIGYINEKLKIDSPLGTNPSGYIANITILQKLYNDLNGVL